MFTLALCLTLAQATGYRVLGAAQEAEYLGGALSESISLSPELRNEILYVSQASDPQRELAAVAKALHASVVKSADRLVIERTVEDRKGEEEGLFNWRKGWMARELDAAKSIRETRLNHTTAYQAIQNATRDPETDFLVLYRLLPSGKLLEEIIKRLGVDKFAGLREGKTLIYETVPVLDAEPLPAIDDLIAEYATSMKSLAGISVSGDFDRFSTLKALGDGHVPQPTLFRLQAKVRNAALEFVFELYDSAGTQVDSNFLALRPQKADLSTSTATLGRIPLDEEARTLAAGFRYEDPTTHLELWTDPVHHEPLRPFVGPAIQAYTATEGNRLVVADLPDRLLEEAALMIDENGLDEATFAGALERRGSMEKLATPDADIWRPRNPEDVEWERADRASLAEFLKEVQAAQRVDARMVGRLYSKPFPVFFSVPSKWISAAKSLGKTGIVQPSFNSDALAIAGAISDESWQRLEAGATMTVSALGVEGLMGEFFKGTRLTFGSFDKKLIEHPDELFRNEAVGQVRVSILTESHAMVATWDPAAQQGFTATVDQLFGSFEDCLPDVSEADAKQIDRLRPKFEENAKRIEIKFFTEVDESLRFTLPQEYTLTEAMPIHEIDVRRPTYADLPQATRDQIWKDVSAKWR